MKICDNGGIYWNIGRENEYWNWWFNRTTRVRFCGNPDCMLFHNAKHWWER